jgi:hypothetical protein
VAVHFRSCHASSPRLIPLPFKRRISHHAMAHSERRWVHMLSRQARLQHALTQMGAIADNEVSAIPGIFHLRTIGPGCSCQSPDGARHNLLSVRSASRRMTEAVFH